MDLDARLTRKAVAEKVGVTPAVVGMWKARGHLGTDERGLYRLGDVLEVERTLRYHPNNRGQRRAGGRWSTQAA